MDSIISLQPILLPKKDSVDYSKWAVIACDQFTAQPEYWEQVKKYVEGSYSTYNLILPEVYLKRDNSENIAAINSAMEQYYNEDIFETVSSGLILTERSTPYSNKRYGLVVCIDLESYSFNTSDCTPIRASEGTILDRIPPRVKIREKAILELPHTMLLISDEKNTIIEAAIADKNKKLLYDFDLNMNGGHIKGWEIVNTQNVLKAFSDYAQPTTVKKVCKSNEGFVLAVGDGNHSLASAKVLWNNIKQKLTPEQAANHPARYALCEIVNIYDEGLSFHPIHRLIKNTDVNKFVRELNKVLVKESGEITVLKGQEAITIKAPQNSIETVEAVQRFIEEQKLEEEHLVVDYIHGDENLKEIVAKTPNSIGLLMPSLNKSEFFSTLAEKKVFPRKAFSIGEAEEKRYYIEARRIRPE